MRDPPTNVGVNTDSGVEPCAKGNESPLILINVVVVAGKAGKTGPGQTKPRQGTTSKPANAGWGAPHKGGVGDRLVTVVRSGWVPA